jgi:hypothetical protein
MDKCVFRLQPSSIAVDMACNKERQKMLDMASIPAKEVFV